MYNDLYTPQPYNRTTDDDDDYSLGEHDIIV